ncbi:MAG: ferric reductase-like transmembrane domain-containing protein [Chloroflexi bacterium]|nr:ferric reductase-like transmembrane domain-containing protein [Chloroflexota bacterium]
MAPRPPLAPVTDLETLEPAVTLDAVLLLLGGAALGGILAAFILPALLPDLAASLLGEQPKAYWYLSRASGVVAYLLLWLSCVLGLSLTNRFARLWAGGPAVADLHQFASLLGLTLLVFHIVILLGDRYASYRVDQLLVPFTAVQHEPAWVGLGQVAAYILFPLTFSFYVRRQIGLRTWRLLHFSSFAVYWLSVAHGIGAGTDTGTGVMLALYIVTASSIVFLTCYRVLVAVGGRRAQRADHPAR